MYSITFYHAITSMSRAATVLIKDIAIPVDQWVRINVFVLGLKQR